MSEFWTTVVDWIKSHWLDLVMVVVIITVLKGLFRQPLDDRGRLITDPAKKPSKYGWYLAGGVAAVYFAVRLAGGVFENISLGKVIWSGVVIAWFAIFFVIAQKQKDLTGVTLFWRGLYGSIAFVLGVIVWIFFGFNIWSFLLLVIGLPLRHAYVIPNRHKGVGILFGKWLVSDDPSKHEEGEEFYDEGHTFWTWFKEYLSPGLCFLPAAFDMPGWDLRLIKDELRYIGSEEEPRFTPELNTMPNDPTDPNGIGGIVKFQFFGRIRTGQNLARMRKLPDKVRNNPEPYVVARVIGCLRKFANSFTLSDHLTKKADESYQNGLKEALDKVYKEIAREFGVSEIKFDILDPEVSAEVKKNVEKAAAADQLIVAETKAGRAAGAKIKAQVVAMEEATTTPAGAAAADRLIELEYARNVRNVRFSGSAGSVGSAAAKLLGKDTDSGK